MTTSGTMPEEPTTPDLVELGQRLTDAINAQDFDALISFYAPDAVFDQPTFGVFEGHAAIRSFIEDWYDAYDEIETEVEERCDLGHGLAFLVYVQRGRLRGSTRWVHARNALVNAWVDGLIQRTTVYEDISQARTAAEQLHQGRGAMPEERRPDPEDRLRRATEEWNRRDFDGVASMYSGSAVIDASSLGIGTFEGHEAIRSVLEDWVQPYEDFRAEFEEFRDFGSGVTFAVLLHRGRPAGSSGFLDVRHTYTHIWTDGLIEWQTVRPDIDEARAAAERLAVERRQGG